MHWAQERDPDRVVISPNMMRHSRQCSDARYEAAARALARAGVPNGTRLLDVGCGISAQADMFRDYMYFGADINYVRLGRGLALHPWARYASQDITRMGWASGSFGAIICLEVIEHVPPARRAELMAELFRVLAPGGLLVLSTPNGRITPWKSLLGKKCERSHEAELPAQEVEKLVHAAGGSIVHREPIDQLVLPAGRGAVVLIQLIAERPAAYKAVQVAFARAAYETILYAIDPPPVRSAALAGEGAD